MRNIEKLLIFIIIIIFSCLLFVIPQTFAMPSYPYTLNVPNVTGYDYYMIVDGGTYWTLYLFENNDIYIVQDGNFKSVRFNSSQTVRYYVINQNGQLTWLYLKDFNQTVGKDLSIGSTIMDSNFIIYDEYNIPIFNPKYVDFINPKDGQTIETEESILFMPLFDGELTIEIYKITEQSPQGAIVSQYLVHKKEFDVQTNEIYEYNDIPWSNGEFVIYVNIPNKGNTLQRIQIKVEKVKSKYIRTNLDYINKVSNIASIDFDTNGYAPYKVYLNDVFIARCESDGNFRLEPGKNFTWRIGINELVVKDSNEEVIYERQPVVYEDTYQDGLENPITSAPDRSKYPEGILGDIAYAIDTLLHWISVPFAYISTLIQNIINLFQTTFSWVGNFANGLGSIFNFLPIEIKNTMISAILIIVFVSIIKAVRR